MLIWQWGLILSSVVLCVMLAFMLTRYISLKKMAADTSVISNDAASQKTIDTQNISPDDKAQWLSLLEQQKNICSQLLSELSAKDFSGRASLSCWAIFLEIEIRIIERSVPNSEIAALLEAFKSILYKVDRAEEIDGLLKSLKVNQSLLRELNKVIQKAGDKVFAQVSITSDLNRQLDKLQSQLAVEVQLDESLALLRAEMASMYELFERLKLHLVDLREEGEDEDAHYINALEQFLDGSEQSDFLHSVRSELDDKIIDLKQLAADQKSIIEALKEEVRNAKLDTEGGIKHLGEYDISIARLEKSLLESSRVVKRLEQKLQNLQVIKHNLKIDVSKRDEALKQKKALLQNNSSSVQSVDIRDVFDEERDAMQNMEDLLYQGDFTEETDAFSAEQASKLSALRLMVNESELYVEMLENDLEKQRLLREELEKKLKSPSDTGVHTSSGAHSELNSQDMEELENLKEINAELEEEQKRLASKLQDAQDLSQDAADLEKKIAELDEKIASTQKQYIEMEERYLAALMEK